MDRNNDEYLIDINTYINNLMSIENIEPYIKRNKSEMVFIRLYDNEFTTEKPYLFDHAVKNSINFFSEKSDSYYDHSGINYTLKDGFFWIKF